MTPKAKSIIEAILIVAIMVICVITAFWIGVGIGVENGKYIQANENKNTLASCQEVAGLK